LRLRGYREPHHFVQVAGGRKVVDPWHRSPPLDRSTARCCLARSPASRSRCLPVALRVGPRSAPARGDRAPRPAMVLELRTFSRIRTATSGRSSPGRHRFARSRLDRAPLMLSSMQGGESEPPDSAPSAPPPSSGRSIGYANGTTSSATARCRRQGLGHMGQTGPFAAGGRAAALAAAIRSGGFSRRAARRLRLSRPRVPAERLS